MTPQPLRRCDECGRDLRIEPAIKGLAGRILCFPCRFRLDTEGGERFLHDSRLYPERATAWETEFARGTNVGRGQ